MKYLAFKRVFALLLCALLQACIALPSSPEFYDFLRVENHLGDKITGTHIQPMQRFLASPDGPRRLQAGDRKSRYVWVGADGSHQTLDFLNIPRHWPRRYLWSIYPVENGSEWIAYRMIPLNTSAISSTPDSPRQEHELLLFNKQRVVHSIKLTADLLPKHAWLRGNDKRWVTTESHYFNIANRHLHYIDASKGYEIIVREHRLTTKPSMLTAQ